MSVEMPPTAAAAALGEALRPRSRWCPKRHRQLGFISAPSRGPPRPMPGAPKGSLGLFTERHPFFGGSALRKALTGLSPLNSERPPASELNRQAQATRLEWEFCQRDKVLPD